jgi:hypothetical protein
MARCAHIVFLFLAALSAVHAHITVVGPLSSMPAVPVREHSYTLGAPNFTIVERHSTPGASRYRTVLPRAHPQVNPLQSHSNGQLNLQNRS